MWSPDASAILLNWRTQLLACSTLSSANFVQNSFHYPNFYFEKDGLPAILVGEKNHRRTRYAEGAAGLISFDVIAKIYLPTGSDEDAGTIETMARDVVLDLW